MNIYQFPFKPSGPKTRTVTSKNGKRKKVCNGDIVILDFRLYSVWCTQLTPMNASRVYMDIKRRIVWLDCGCHSYLNRPDKSNKPHATFKECDNNIQRLLNCSLIGYVKKTSNKECTKYFQIEDDIFEVAEFIHSDLHCGNCKLLLCSKLPQWIARLMDHKSILFRESNKSEFSEMFFVYIVCTLLSYCLSNAHTAKIIVGAETLYVKRLIHFIEYAVTKLHMFHEKSTDDDKHDAIIFKVFCGAFTKMMKLWLQHSSKMQSHWFGIPHSNGLFPAIVHCIDYLGTQCRPSKGTASFKLMYLMSKHEDNGMYVSVNMMMALFTFIQYIGPKHSVHYSVWEFLVSAIYGEDAKDIQGFIQNMHSFRNTCGTPMHRPTMLQFAFHAQYLKIQNRKLKWKYVKCQWMQCNNKKLDLIKLNKIKQWKKCKACKVARYCSRNCQKRDWKHGVHKAICGFYANNI
eukprot:186140_1